MVMIYINTKFLITYKLIKFNNIYTIYITKQYCIIIYHLVQLTFLNLVNLEFFL